MRQKSASRNNKAAISKRSDSSSSSTSKRKSIQRPTTAQRPSTGQRPSTSQLPISRISHSLQKLSQPSVSPKNLESIMITIQNDEYIPINQPSSSLNFEIQKSSIQRPITADASFLEEEEPNSVQSYSSSVGRRYVMPSTVLHADV